jgi:predicted metal-dependent TIM-barrel fold hydrolase
MYGNQFVGDVATDAFKKNVKTFNIDTAVDSARKLETMQKLRNSGQTLDPYYQVGVDQNIVPDDLPEYILPLSQLKQDYPKAQLVPLGKQTNV